MHHHSYENGRAVAILRNLLGTASRYELQPNLWFDGSYACSQCSSALENIDAAHFFYSDAPSNVNTGFHTSQYALRLNSSFQLTNMTQEEFPTNCSGDSANYTNFF